MPRENNKFWISVTIILGILTVISLCTHYYGSTDVIDYAGVAKFFAEDYSAKLRSSHSLVYGFMHAPLVKLFGSIFVMKVTSLLWLFLIMLSVWHISGRDRRTILLLIASPIVWYIGPWINPLQLAGLGMLWAFYHINKFDRTGNERCIWYSGILAGLASCVWNAALFIAAIMGFVYFYRRTTNQAAKYLIALAVGLLPLFIIDMIFYSFPLYSTIKYLTAVGVGLLYGSIYQGVNQLTNSLIDVVSLAAILPWLGYSLFKKEFFMQRKRAVIFLALATLFLFTNPQMRYLIVIWPIIILYLSKCLNEKQYKIQLAIFIALSITAALPYIVQFNNGLDRPEINDIVKAGGSLKMSEQFIDETLNNELAIITEKYGGGTVLVGNEPDDYARLAMAYAGFDILEFVSIQDYGLWLGNESDIFEKKLVFTPKIADRRQIWIGGGIQKSANDPTNYSSISYALGIGNEIHAPNFTFIENYSHLYVSRKS